MIHRVNSGIQNRKINAETITGAKHLKITSKVKESISSKINIILPSLLPLSALQKNFKNQALYMLQLLFKYPMFKQCAMMHHIVEVGQWRGHSLPLQ